MEEHARLAEPDIILPTQYYGALTRSRTEVRGEWRLLFAVLDDALRCFQRTAYSRDPQERTLFAETAAWIMEEADCSAGRAGAPRPGFVFVDVCTALDLDPGFVRARLWQWYRSRRCSERPPRHRRA